MFDSFPESANVIRDLLRTLFAALDRPIYGLLMLVYELFFNVASADIFSNNTIMKFYGRVQVILGVFMMFQLAMTILRGIVDPDSFSKEKGGGTLLKRVSISLILITILMPINVGSPRNEYEIQINNNGLLFGTLYSLQHRILSNNSIGRLVLGTTGNDSTFMNSKDEDELAKSARIFTSTVLKGFYRINLVPEDQRKDSGGKDPATINENRMCTDIDDKVLAAYTRIDADPGEILSMVNETCTQGFSLANIANSLLPIKAFEGTEKYVFTYSPIVSLVVGIVFIFVLLSFTIDVAVRAIKLAVLRLIAPIPIIAYMDPKGSKDEMFKSWTKTLTSTYLDLFIRLAVVYFVIFLIQDMIVNGIVITHGTGVLGTFSLIVIWIGLFIFAKQAPDFIKKVLGLKDSKFSLFSGFGEFGAAAGMAAAIPGAIGSGIASARASRMADETRKEFGEKNIFGGEIRPDSFFNRGKHLLAGMAGTFAGGATGMKAAATAKDHGFNASVEAMRKRNVEALSRGNDGSTLFGRIGSTASNIFTGEGRSTAIEREINTNKSRLEALKAVKSRVSGEMVKKDWTYGDLGIKTDVLGYKIGKVNYRQFQGDLAEAKARGDGYVHSVDESGHAFTIALTDGERQNGFLLKNNENDYIEKQVQGKAKEVDGHLMTLIHNAEVLGGSSDFTRNADGTISKGPNKHITNRSSINDAIDGFEDYNVQLNRQNSTNKANDRFSGGKK